MAECFEVEIESLNLDGKGVSHREGKFQFYFIIEFIRAMQRWIGHIHDPFPCRHTVPLPGDFQVRPGCQIHGYGMISHVISISIS